MNKNNVMLEIKMQKYKKISLIILLLVSLVSLSLNVRSAVATNSAEEKETLLEIIKKRVNQVFGKNDPKTNNSDITNLNHSSGSTKNLSVGESYVMKIGTVYNNDEYRNVDNTAGPWIYAFGVSPDAPNLAGSIGIRVDGNKSENAALIVGKGKGQFADVYASDFKRGSDRKLKKDIKTFSNPLEHLKNIRGVKYVLKSNNNKSIGVIAQEIEKDFPDLVSEGPNGYKMVNYDGFTGVFIEAIKEQQKQIENQQKEINELKAMVKSLQDN